MKLLDAIKNLEKNKAAELLFSDIIDYVNSIKDGDNELFDLRTLDLVESNIQECLKFLELKKKSCYDNVKKLSNLEIKDDTKNRSTRKPPSGKTDTKSKRRSKKV